MNNRSTIFIFFLCFILQNSYGQIDEPTIIDRVVVHQEDGYFMAWPANNGIWSFEDGEIIVGFTRGPYRDSGEFHHVEPPYSNMLANSKDGGFTWEAFQPKGFIGIYDPKGKVGDSALALKDISAPLNFKEENLIIRVIAAGYLQPDLLYKGKKVPEGGFFYSSDRGRSWQGPFLFNGLSAAKELKGMEITSRTDYIKINKDTALFFLSARTPGVSRSDKSFVAKTTDGGMTFNFTGWIVKPDDPFRAVMPSAVKTPSGRLISAIRRRDMGPITYCWIDIYSSDDNGISWSFLSRAGETGVANGNPPAMIQLTDGRLVLAYGNREHRQIRARFSADEGKTWGAEFILKKDIEEDLGYPRMMQNKDGMVVTIYYCAPSPTSEKYIEATIWDPGNKNKLAEVIELSKR